MQLNIERLEVRTRFINNQFIISNHRDEISDANASNDYKLCTKHPIMQSNGNDRLEFYAIITSAKVIA